MSDAAFPGNSGRNDYPRMIYHPDGRTRVVATPVEENDLISDGWRQNPWPAHQKRAATPSIAATINDPLAIMFRQILEQVLDERGVGRAPGGAPAAPAEHPQRHSRR